ncbi:MAG: hypothetical protein HRU25_01980 [Psychrobium sp.]|nr:hypothetical protein [Psychrobium sp.]
MQPVSKNESMLLIQHAISAYLNEGRNQKELGELLGLEGSRISEYKRGKGKLLPSQRQIIIDNYGYPRRGKGQYMNAEVYDSVNEFTDNYSQSSKERLKHRIYELLTRADYQKEILDCINVIDGTASDDEKLRFLDELLLLPKFKFWYNECKNKHTSADKELHIELSILTDAGLNYIVKPDSKLVENLYRIAFFKFELMSDFSFHMSDVTPSVKLNELVINGDIVLEFKGDTYRLDEIHDESFKINERVSLSFNDLTTNSLGSDNDIFGFRKPPYCYSSNTQFFNSKPDKWGRVILRLYLSENMNYHLWIRLDDGSDFETDKQAIGHGEVRNIVISNLCHINFLKEIELIRKWCGCSTDLSNDIKHEVSKLGGYIPGAKVLD